MRDWVQKVVKSKKFFVMAAALVAMQPLYGVFVAPTASAASQVVTGNTSTWLFNRDASTSTPYRFTTSEASTGYGSLYVEPIGAANPSDKFVAEYFGKTEISQLQSISYDFMIDGVGTAASAKQFYLNVYATVDNSDEYYDCRFDYAPAIGSTSSFTTASFNATDTPTNVTKRGDRIAGCPATLAEMPADSHMRAFAINLGGTSLSDAGLAGYFDNVVMSKTTGVEAYDFERELPTLSYVLPTSTNQTFRPGDNPMRVKVGDSEQIESVKFSLYHYDMTTGSFGSHIGYFTVDRSQCDLRAAGNYVLCDIKKSDTWTPLAEGAYAAKLTVDIAGEAVIRTPMSDYWSQPFVVDTTAPTVDSFALENPTSGFATTSATVAATASDASGVESVNFYITTPREDDACTGNGAKLAETRVGAVDGDGKYRTTLDTSALADGTYCITAVVRDHAKSNSSLQHIKIVVDKTAPTLQVTTPSENAVFGGDDQIIITSYMEDAWGLSNYFVDINSAEVTLLSDPAQTETLPEATTTETTSAEAAGLTVVAIYNAADFTDGEYVITVRVTDKAGNVSEETRTIFIDHSVPTPGQGMVPPSSEETDEAVSELAQLAERLTQPFSVPLNFASSTGDAQTNQDVLGTQQDSEKEVASGEQTVAAVPSPDGWKIFGIAWYWWLLVAAVLGAVTAWIMRRRNANGA